MIKRNFFLLIIVILLFNSCDILNPEESNLTAINSKILFRVEDLCWKNGAYEPGISIYMETAENYPCCNYWIETKERIRNNTLHVKIFGVDETDFCATAFGPARNILGFEQLQGKYLLNFHNVRQGDQYELVITDSLISLTPKISRFTEAEYFKLWRRPKNSFAIICRAKEDSALFKGFLDTLSQVIDMQEFRFPETGELSYPSERHQHHTVKYFKYEKESDFYLIRPVLKAYKEQNFDEPNSITIINWIHEVIYSSYL